MRTNDVTATGPPETSEVVLRFRSEPLVPTSPSSTKVVPSDLTMRNHVAVPVAFAELSCVMAFNVYTPPDAAGANVALHVNSANNVVAVPAVAGRVPL